jgi:hypothetical protein
MDKFDNPIVFHSINYLIMDPQIIDYYNETPHEVNVIDKMNEELDEVQKENDNLKKKLEEYDKIMKKYQMPRVKVESVEEYQLLEKKLEEFEEFIDVESNNFSSVDLHNHYHNYGRHYDMMHGPGCIEDENGFIYKSISKLDDLTNHQNREWCEHRILIAIEMFMKTEGDVHTGIEVNLSGIIFGLNNNSDQAQLPLTYCELSRLNRPSWTDQEDLSGMQGHNILNIPYYNCENCGKLDDTGDCEAWGGLFCIDCQLD